MAIDRTFQEIPEGKLTEADQQSLLVNLGWAEGVDWQELLRSKRVLIVSEAGAGKTYECETQCKRVKAEGESAFFLELAALATSDLCDMLDLDELAQLDAWIASQSDIATFFLDSYDELKLSRGSFEQALKRLTKGLAGQLGRARIVITTRPIPFDEELVRRLLPVPPLLDGEASGDTFAEVAMGDSKQKKTNETKAPDDWRIVALMPLSDSEILEFAEERGVDEPKELLKDLQQRNAQEFARRPQDLIELCADWRDHKRIRSHRDQVEANIRIKLSPREDRPEPAELSVEKAIEGAGCMALAMMTTRRLTIRHDAKFDIYGNGVALDPKVILSDWNAAEHKALLERPLFGFASYGRVRFHHRSVAEYLAALRIQTLRKRGMPTAALKRLIFTETKGKIIVRPSKRPIAGWLALTENMVFETLRDHEPAVLFTEGDPASLTPSQRGQALRAYVERYGQGGWRGLNVPHIQIHRLASPDLASEISSLWSKGIENHEVREILLQLIEMGTIVPCADIAHVTAIDTESSRYERILAVEALAALKDPRLEAIVAHITDNPSQWPNDLARNIAVRLFPKHLTPTRLCQILARTDEDEGSMGDLNWHLPWTIREADLDSPTLNALRDGLVDLVSSGLKWENAWSPLHSDRGYLNGSLAATCVRGLKNGVTVDWLSACALAFRLARRDSDCTQIFSELAGLLEELPAKDNARLFWEDDKLIQFLHPIADSWERYQNAYDGSAKIRRNRDGRWLNEELANAKRSPADRAFLLEFAARIWTNQEERTADLIGLCTLVADLPELERQIDDWLEPPKRNEKHERWEKEAAETKRNREQKKAEQRKSWVEFWHKVVEHPEAVFAPERSGNTAWNLWRAMQRADADGRASGWNRRFIEAHFGKKTADRLRHTLMKLWREDRPTLVSV